MPRLTLPQLYEQHTGHISDKWSIYLSEYDRIFSPYRDLPVRLLEIGMQNGGSMEIWAKYFENARNFVGCDVDPACAKLQTDDQRFNVIIGNATQASTQSSILKASDHFDIIIDDGSHHSSEIVRAFACYFPFLQDGGVFIAANLDCSYGKEFEGGLFAPFSAMSFFKRLADIPNFEHWGIDTAPVDILSGFLANYGFQMDAESLLHIRSVTFSNSMCAVFKLGPEHNRLGRPSARSEREVQAVADPAGPPEDPLSPLQQIERPALLARLGGLHREVDAANEQLAGMTSSRAVRAALLLRRWKGLLFSPKGLREIRTGITIKLTETRREAGIKLRQLAKAVKAIPVQDRLIKQMYSPDAKKLILFLVPGYDVVNGGIMSIVSIAQTSRELEPEHGAQVIATTMPRHFLLTRYSKFPNTLDIFRFAQLFSYFHRLDELIIHIPEYHVPEFPAFLNESQKDFLRRIPHLQLNILIQNIWLAPSRKAVDDLRQLTDDITATTAHRKYCTPEYRARFGIPLHHLSVEKLTQFYYKPYAQKEDLLVVSHDQNPHKEMVLERLSSEHPGLQVVPVQNMLFEDYKQLISRAKWVVTFGEGIDGYFIEGIRSGAIGFAVYNPDFFSDHFLNLPNIFNSYEAMLRDLPDTLRRLDNPSAFRELSNLLIERDKLEYNADAYRENVRRFYRRDYRLP